MDAHEGLLLVPGKTLILWVHGMACNAGTVKYVCIKEKKAPYRDTSACLINTARVITVIYLS